MYDLEYPYITADTANGKTEQIINFLWKTTERLNYVLGLLLEGNGQVNIAETKGIQPLPFAKAESTSTSTNFTAQAQGITELRDGICVFLTNGIVNSATGFTLNINGLGAKPVYLTTGTRATTEFNSAKTAMFVYNSGRVTGGCWDMY